MFSMLNTFVTRTVSPYRLGWTDILSYLYLGLGTFIMFGPIIWLVMSSFKTPAGLIEFPPTFLPFGQETIEVEGYDEPLLMFRTTMEDGSVQDLAQIRRIGLEAQLVDPAAPEEIIRVPIDSREPIRSLQFAWNNYTEPLQRFSFLTYLRNSVVVTVVATAITLLINSMAAFALSKYNFRGKNVTFVVIISTLLIPVSVILVPVFLVVTTIGWTNNLWGIIIPGAATPTGVFLLRQYMLTIPDELIEAARIDG
ncbi:MAG: carbohydrate ABC transporter permease, partial [Chloroflexota bacterium]